MTVRQSRDANNTEDNNRVTTALIERGLTDNQIKQRIDLNKQAGWGLEKGTPSQLNLVFLICQKYQLLPGDEVTLYDGKPWITIDGRVTLMRRHPNYLTFKNRPLTKDEKETWGYDPDDLVVECTIKLQNGEEISARGKVSKAEREGKATTNQRLNYVARIHPVEMAEKRAIARAERFAFGQEAFIDDEQAEEIQRLVVEQRNDPERRAALAARYDETIGSFYDAEHESQEAPDDDTQVPVQAEL